MARRRKRVFQQAKRLYRIVGPDEHSAFSICTLCAQGDLPIDISFAVLVAFAGLPAPQDVVPTRSWARVYRRYQQHVRDAGRPFMPHMTGM